MIEAVDVPKDDGERLQPSEQEDADQGGIRIQEETDGFLEAQDPGPDKSLVQDASSGDVQGSELGFGSEGGVARALAQPFGPSVKDIGSTCLGQEAEDEEQHRRIDPRQLPDSPSPTHSLRREPPDQRPQRRSDPRTQLPQTQTVRSFEGKVHVADGGTTQRHGWRSKEAGEEAKDQDSLYVRGQSDGKLKEHEDSKRDDIDGVSPDSRNLRQRRPEHGTCGVAYDRERSAKRRNHLASMKILHDAGNPRSVDRGSEVEETVQEEDLGAYESFHTRRKVERVLGFSISCAY